MVNMKATFFLKLLAVSAVLGLACAAVDIEKIAARCCDPTNVRKDY